VCLGLGAVALPATALGQVDLQALDAVARPPTVFLQDELVVDVQIDRPMGAYGGPLEVRLRRSNDAVIDAADPVMFTVQKTISSTVTEFSVRGPVPRVQGSFFVIAELDPANDLVETNESNNEVLGAPFDIIGGDLDITSLSSVGPAQAIRGEPFDFRLEHRNRGPSTVEGVEVVVTFRPRGSPATEILRTTPDRLQANASRARVETFTIPVGTATGTAELTATIIVADPVDPDPLNNVEVLEFGIRERVPDLRGGVIATSTAIEAGGRLVVRRIVENTGFADAEASEIQYVLSEDDDIRVFDLSLGRVPIPALPVDAFEVRSDELEIPITTTPGTYNLGFVIDPDGRLDEVDEDNGVVGPRVTIFAPDLQIVTESLPLARLDIPYDVALVAAGGPTPDYRWQIVAGSVPGLELDASTGILTGTPTQLGRYPLTIRVLSANARADRELTLRVVESVAPLQIVDAMLRVGIIGRPYEGALLATGGLPPYRWTALQAVPAGLALSPEGRLTGTLSETSTGTYAFAVQVEDDAGSTATATASLTVVQVTQGVTLLVDPLPDARLGAPYCDPEPIRLRAEGEFPPFVFSTAFAPPGLELSEGGRLCGTPERVGTSTFAVNVRDEVGFVDDGIFRLRVRSDDSVDLVDEALPPATVGAFYEAEIRAEGGMPPYRFDLSTGELPPGIDLEPGGRLAGTSTVSDRFVFAVRATDARGASGQAGFGLVVLAPGGDGSGCDCRTSGGMGARSAWLALGLVGLGLARRRRSSRRSS